MRRTVLLVAVMALAVVAALADNIEGNGGNNRLVGTNGKDAISAIQPERGDPEWYVFVKAAGVSSSSRVS